MSDYADALARRNLQLPRPDGANILGADVYWRLSSGGLLFVRGSDVYTSHHDPRTVAEREADALAVLAACAWARTRAGGAG